GFHAEVALNRVRYTVCTGVRRGADETGARGLGLAPPSPDSQRGLRRGLPHRGPSATVRGRLARPCPGLAAGCAAPDCLALDAPGEGLRRARAPGLPPGAAGSATQAGRGP